MEFKYAKEFDKLCSECKEYTDNLPTYELDNRLASLIAWCLAYQVDDYETLPIFWRKTLGTLFLGLRLLRVGAGCKERSDEITDVAVSLLEYTWNKKSRMYIYRRSMGCWVKSRFDFQQCYDTLWTVWEAVSCQ